MIRHVPVDYEAWLRMLANLELAKTLLNSAILYANTPAACVGVCGRAGQSCRRLPPLACANWHPSRSISCGT